MLAESESGYVLDMNIYTGSTTYYLPEYEQNHSKTEAVVLTLMHPYLNKGYQLFVDNYFTSVDQQSHGSSANVHVSSAINFLVTFVECSQFC